MRATADAMGLLMAIAQPQHTSRILALQAAANREAKSAHRRALDGLAQAQEEAEIATRIATIGIEPSAAFKSAEEEARQAKANAKAANREASAAGVRFYEHQAERPSGWRSALAWATGANARYDDRATQLKRAKEAAEHRAEDGERASQAATRQAEQAREADARDARDLREKRRQDVRHTGTRSEAASRALQLLEHRPALAGMGVEALIQLGRRLLSQESTVTTDPSDVLKPTPR